MPKQRTSKVARRLRLSPHDRRMQLLDCAGRIVLDHGLSKFTIDALATEAEVSVPLVYKYFDTRIEILQALLVREAGRLNALLKERLEDLEDYDQFVRTFVKINFDGVRTGSLLSVLFSQPDVRSGLNAADIEWVSESLVRRTAKHYGLTTALAIKMLHMASAASRAAAKQFGRTGGDQNQEIDRTVKFITGALRAVGEIAP